MDVAVIIPWRSGCPYRAESLRWVTERLSAHYGWPIFLGGCDPAKPFNRAEAILNGAREADADVLVIHDGDVWLQGDLTESTARVKGKRWVVPHRLLRRLTKAASRQVFDDDAPLVRTLDLDQRAYIGNPTGTLAVMTAELLFDVPPDRRFVGWGQEDEAWWLALETLVGRCQRYHADLYHLWHPPAQRLDRRVGSVEGLDLLRRYEKAARSPTALASMRELVEESKAR